MNQSNDFKKFIKGFCLQTDSGNPLTPDIPPEGVDVETHPSMNNGYYGSRWGIIIPQAQAQATSVNEDFRARTGSGTWGILKEWRDLIRQHPLYFRQRLYRLADMDSLENVYGYGTGSNSSNSSQNQYILMVELDLAWGAAEFHQKGCLPIDYMKAVYCFLRSMSSTIQLRDSENEIPTPDPPGFLLKLYDYQSRTLTWMRRIESGELKIRYFKEYYHPLPTPASLSTPTSPSAEGEVGLAEGEPFCYVSSRDIEETAKTMAFYQCFTEPPCRYREFPIHGGLLADIMGNGKTVTGIAHICSQKAYNGYNTFPTLQPGLERDVYLPSRATLILCPNNILDQWYSEFEKCLGPAMTCHYRILKIGNIRQFKALSHWDLIHADVVIASYGLLSNPTHVGKGFVQKYGLSKQFTENRGAKHLIPELTDSPETWENSVYEELQTALPEKHLYLYKWYRIIHDEFHEVINVKTRTNCLLLLVRAALRAKYYWGFSGTPILEHETVLENLPHLLQFQDDWGEILPMKNGNKEMFFDKCVIKNTKRHLPPLRYRTINIPGTTQEHQLYQTLRAATSSSEELVRFACYHNLGNYGVTVGAGNAGAGARSLLSAESIMEAQAEKRTKKIATLTSYINDSHACLTGHESSLKAMSSLPKYTFTKNWKTPKDLYFLCDSNDKAHNAPVRVALENDAGLRRAREILRKYRKEEKGLRKLVSDKKSLEDANALYEKFKENRVLLCQLCGHEGACDEFLSIPGCQHSACSECMNLMCEGSQKLCPVCRTSKFDGERLAKLVGQDAIQEQNLSPSGLNITLWGSKIAAVIDALVALDPEDKVLIFAQWTDLLDQLKVAMRQVGIQSVTVEGTTASRARAIRQFQTDPASRVILLSSVHGTSGINLVEGNHVFLVHHFLGSAGKEYEYQAICRAYRTGQKRPVTVTHFIREDTLERTLHEKRTYMDEAGTNGTNGTIATPLITPGKRLTRLPSLSLPSSSKVSPASKPSPASKALKPIPLLTPVITPKSPPTVTPTLIKPTPTPLPTAVPTALPTAVPMADHKPLKLKVLPILPRRAK